jgi:hypothetical protein
MKLPRPYIPLDVRLKVFARQFGYGVAIKHGINSPHWRLADLQEALASVFGGPVHLDHDPALVNRKFNARTGKYTPDANDPDYLVYRSKTDHDIKTRVRGDGAQYSDLALRRKLKRIQRNRKKGRGRRRIA